MKLSICMIAKNEEAYIEQSLASVNELADEIIVVDTGSTDKTKEIASKMGAKIFEETWKEDFSAARNAAISHATGDWILMLDADEMISTADHQLIRDALRGNAMGYLLIQRNYTNDTSSPAWKSSTSDTYTESKQYDGWFETRLLRLFRRDDNIQYTGKVHESVKPSITAQGGAIEQLSVPIHHYGKVRDKSYVEQKGQMYAKLGEEKLEENADAKAAFELGIAAMRQNKLSEAVEKLELAIEKNPTYVRAMMNLGAVLIKTGNIERAISTLERAASIKRVSAVLTNLGVAYERAGQANKAIKLYEEAHKKNPTNVQNLQNIARILFALKQYDALGDAWEQIISLQPSNIAVYHNLGALYVNQKKYDDAIRVLSQAADLDDTGKSNLRLAQAYVLAGNKSEARVLFEKTAAKHPELKDECTRLLNQI